MVLIFLSQTLQQVSSRSTYSILTLQCHKCCCFGHVREQCRFNPRCSRCAELHDSLNCDTSDSSGLCIPCSGHVANRNTNNKYSDNSRQRNIKLVMSEENTSYIEAACRFSPAIRSFSDIASTYLPKSIYICKPPSNYITPPTSEIQSQPLISSYKKTIHIERRPRHELGKSYDLKAHYTITSTPPSSFPNGCVMSTASQSNSSSDNLINS